MGASIWLIRHGETEWSRDLKHTGMTDVPLTPEGEKQADAVCAELVGITPTLVLCSPMKRARETAQRAGLTPDEITDDLLERDYGAWEGRTTHEIRRSLGNPTWTVWDNPMEPGDTPGETLDEVAVRVDRVIARCLPVVQAGGDCILVAHGHVLRILTARWLGLPPIDGKLFALDPARLSALGFEHENHVIRQWNAS